MKQIISNWLLLPFLAASAAVTGNGRKIISSLGILLLAFACVVGIGWAYVSSYELTEPAQITPAYWAERGYNSLPPVPEEEF